MRVLFTVWPATAHLYPIVPLAWALQSAGHDVRVAAHPALVPAVTAVGLTPVRIGDPATAPAPRAANRPLSPETEARLDRLTGRLALDPTGQYAWGAFRRFMIPCLRDFHPAGASPADPMPAVDDLVAHARAWRPDLMIWDPCWPSAAVAARVAGAAHARFLWGLDYFAWTTETLAARPDTTPEENPLADAVRPVAERHGVDVDDELLHGQWTIDPIPPPMRLPTRTVRTVPVRWIPFTGASPLPDWLRTPPERPRVALTLGVSVRKFFKDGTDRVGALLDAVDGLDADVVATLDDEQLQDLPPLPPNVRTVDYVPLGQLLPTTSAVIHHGGIGTFAAAAALGVPQLVDDEESEFIVVDDHGTRTTFRERHMDAPPTSAYVAARGAGLPLDRHTQSTAEMRHRIRRVLEDDSFRTGAAALHQDLLAMPGPHDIVPVLERLTARHAARRTEP
ncbi:nucleotide disphospho-sugar-binding domain-containing protein [Streptomyces griseus]|uniref:nucleotide disphospho-sugar-binding domain-containing protein n=1 Tax=Streptomyces griseus TaxID=1911 RepID=UPI0004C57FEA|nr:nucleotide disphospho-sugar-binding domain-containing protein [Streptomyces griseus]